MLSNAGAQTHSRVANRFVNPERTEPQHGASGEPCNANSFWDPTALVIRCQRETTLSAEIRAGIAGPLVLHLQNEPRTAPTPSAIAKSHGPDPGACAGAGLAQLAQHSARACPAPALLCKRQLRVHVSLAPHMWRGHTGAGAGAVTLARASGAAQLALVLVSWCA